MGIHYLVRQVITFWTCLIPRQQSLTWDCHLPPCSFYMLSSSLFGLILFSLLSSELSPAVPHLEPSCSYWTNYSWCGLTWWGPTLWILFSSIPLTLLAFPFSSFSLTYFINSSLDSMFWRGVIQCGSVASRIMTITQIYWEALKLIWLIFSWYCDAFQDVHFPLNCN